MSQKETHITKLISIRNHYGKDLARNKLQLLETINRLLPKSKKALQAYYDTLLFLITYPDSKAVYHKAKQSLQQLQSYIQSKEKIKDSLYNSGISPSIICAAFSFEIVKWLRKTNRAEIKLSFFNANDAQIQSILSVVMPKVESEILQDANAEWKGWLKRSQRKGKELLDQLIDIFDSSDIRPDVRDELWNAIGINVEINFSSTCCLPDHLIKSFYHRSLMAKNTKLNPVSVNPQLVYLNKEDAETIIECSRKVLISQLREIDPISFTSANLVSFYHLDRGISIALMGMVADRRHPIDSYMGYMVFKNGFPIAYAGSWILFNSGRIGLNVFPAYRGGESRYIFQQVLHLHQQVYHLKRFTVDPYQIGKENADGIRSGAYWVYHHAGFRPVLKGQQQIAEAEALKIKSIPGYRTPAGTLKNLADSRLQWVLHNTAVQFDATDLSICWANILEKKYSGNRNLINEIKTLAAILQIKNYQEGNMNFVLQNWALLLLANEKELRANKPLHKTLKNLFALKANGSEEAYIKALQKTSALRIFLEDLLKTFCD